jgi:hypothetical protein
MSFPIQLETWPKKDAHAGICHVMGIQVQTHDGFLPVSWFHRELCALISLSDHLTLFAPIASTMSSSERITMIPYLHFAGGDHLYFSSWQPSSHAAIAGASIALFVLAILERLLRVTRGALDTRWRRRYGLYDYSH